MIHYIFSSFIFCFRILCSIVILGKACDLIDYHQQNKNLIETTPKKNEKVVSTTNNSGNGNTFVGEGLTKNTTDVAISKPSLILATIETKSKKNRNPSDDLENSFDRSEVPLSPISPRTMEATNKDLRMSAIVLDSKIQNLFAKRSSLLHENPSIVKNEHKKMDDSDKTNIEKDSSQQDNIGLVQEKENPCARDILNHKSNLATMSQSVSSLGNPSISCSDIRGIKITNGNN